MNNKASDLNLDDKKLATLKAFTIELEKLYNWISSNVAECQERRSALVDLMSAEKWIHKAILSPNHNFKE